MNRNEISIQQKCINVPKSWSVSTKLDEYPTQFGQKPSFKKLIKGFFDITTSKAREEALPSAAPVLLLPPSPEKRGKAFPYI